MYDCICICKCIIFTCERIHFIKCGGKKKCHATTNTSVKGDNLSPGKDFDDLFPLGKMFLFCRIADGSLFIEENVMKCSDMKWCV